MTFYQVQLQGIRPLIVHNGAASLDKLSVASLEKAVFPRPAPSRPTTKIRRGRCPFAPRRRRRKRPGVRVSHSNLQSVKLK